MKKSTRLLKIYAQLRKAPVTIASINTWAKKNDVQISERTLYRDLAEIEIMMLLDNEQIVVEEGEKNRKTWKIEHKKSSNEFTIFDIDSFNLLTTFVPLSIKKARKETFEKIETTFYKQLSKSKFEKTIFANSKEIATTNFYELDYSKDFHIILQDFIWAIKNNKKVQIQSMLYGGTTHFASQIFPFTILPTQILYHRGGIHIVGLEQDREKVKIILLEQIETYALINELFNIKKVKQIVETETQNRFGIDENIDAKTYNIKLEFSALTGSFVKNQHWHSSQKFVHQKNGNYYLFLKCGISRELVGWIFQWMNNVKVISPAKLTNLVTQKYTDCKNLYNTKNTLASSNSFRAKQRAKVD